MRVLGLMSGTSVDGVDAAVADLTMDGDTLRMELVGHTTLDWPAHLRDRVLAILPPATSSAGEICRLDHDLGVALGESAATALREIGAGTVELVASHGQTIHHEVGPDGAVLGTLQVGQPAEIAERTGVPVVADFRARDVAAGGQGAPLVSVLDHLLLAGTGEPAALLNLGGIANLTAVRPGEPTVAFDCGPANALIDLAVRRESGEQYDAGGVEQYDAGGVRTARGTVDPMLLDVLLADPYLAAQPPKSTGKERYNSDFLAAMLERAPVAEPDDVLATLAEAVAAAVAADVQRLGLRRVWASGGGTHNAGLMRALGQRLDAAGATLSHTAELGVPGDHKEAHAFALLGWLTWHGLPGSLASCTGAAGPRILGTIVPGAGPLRLPEPVAESPRRLVVATA